MIYDYQCQECGVIREVICRMDERPAVEPCLLCPGEMTQIITAPVIRCDDAVNVPWIRDFAHHHNRKGGKRDRFGGKPIESRQDYKDYLKTHDLRETESESTVHFPEDAEHDRIAKEMGMKP